MQNVLRIQCPVELLLELHTTAEAFSELMKTYVAFALFKEGKISSGMAAQWLNMPRMTFLLNAMERGVELLDDSEDDLRREMALTV